MKAEKIEEIIKHHLKGNYLTSDAGITILAKDILNYSQQQNPEGGVSLGEICHLCNEPFRLYGTELRCECKPQELRQAADEFGLEDNVYALSKKVVALYDSDYSKTVDHEKVFDIAINDLKQALK